MATKLINELEDLIEKRTIEEGERKQYSQAFRDFVLKDLDVFLSPVFGTMLEINKYKKLLLSDNKLSSLVIENLKLENQYIMSITRPLSDRDRIVMKLTGAISDKLELWIYPNFYKVNSLNKENMLHNENTKIPEYIRYKIIKNERVFFYKSLPERFFSENKVDTDRDAIKSNVETKYLDMVGSEILWQNIIEQLYLFE